MAAKKKSSKAMDYIVSRLKQNPNVEYASVKKGAAKKRLTVYPIMFGRAMLLLGLVKPAKKKAKKGSRRPKKKRTKRGPGRPRKASGRGPGRPRKVGRRGRPSKASSPIAAVQDLVSIVEEHARSNRELRETLEKVRHMITRVL